MPTKKQLEEKNAELRKALADVTEKLNQKTLSENAVLLNELLAWRNWQDAKIKRQTIRGPASEYLEIAEHEAERKLKTSIEATNKSGKL